MDSVNILPAGSIGKGFIPAEYLPQGKDEYHIRNEQAPWPLDRWHHLAPDQIKQLTANNNTASNWDEVLVTNDFDMQLVRNCQFFGLVRIGRITNLVLEYDGLRLPAGITNSRMISCDIGDDCAIHDVRHLSHYIIGDRCILSDIGEMRTTNAATFGNGIIKAGLDESSRLWLDVMNESGCRRILPFDRMVPADAYLWVRYRDDAALQDKLRTITQNSFDSRHGAYGQVGIQSVIRSCRLVQDVKVGTHCRIAGAARLDNLTINSDGTQPTAIGADVELVAGIVGFGCDISSGSRAVRFVLGENTNLRFGARVTNSVIGDNSTIACCEVLNNLIFPAHEQHHNNSFLIASLVMGQSNVAAGATIGSNHNSRANDGEIVAGRGFWPGLCTSLKHPSRFASFVLLAKGDYPSELDIPLPFSLVSNNAAADRLEVIPAFWWLYNMYALARNSAKFRQRDKRARAAQHIEFDYLAPDTIQEVEAAAQLLAIWTAKADLRKKGLPLHGALDVMGKSLLLQDGAVADLEVLGENMEHSKRKVVIIKPAQAYRAYNDMMCYYAVRELMPLAPFSNIRDTISFSGGLKWVNLGGQLVPAWCVDELRRDIVSGALLTWNDIHIRYDTIWRNYHVEKLQYAWLVLCGMSGNERLTKEEWLAMLDRAGRVQQYICEQVYISRKKDFDNPFRKITCRKDPEDLFKRVSCPNAQEYAATTGSIEDNAFVKQVRKETEDFMKALEEARKKG